MKKNILLSIAGLSIIVLASFGFSGSNTTNDDFVPIEKGKTYKLFFNNQQIKFTILEEPKGNWVKADMKGGGNVYLNLDIVAMIKIE